ncbi:MAG: type II toxin-antitoxin system VapC family toxin [Syntrophales bacterium]|jgi:predicted nucleic acid-binding protein|nr:type II toxin-antitoxin system VapC family toxin [Syntrophales bacterium]
MELVDQLRGKIICIDTAPFIYFIEKDPKYLNVVRPIFAEIDAGNIEALTSTITLLEVLVLPFKKENESLAEEYREILLHAEGLTTYEIVHEVSELSAKLRAKYAIRTPDAIQIAVGILYGAAMFLTNDSGLKKVKDINVLILEDFSGK